MSTQHNDKLYCPLLLKLPLGVHAINLNYVEILDKKTIDMNHIHNSYEICFCLENSIIVKAGNCEHTLHPGEFLLIMRGTPHNVIYDPERDKKYFIMIFDLPDYYEYNEKKHPMVSKIDRLSRTSMAVKGFCPVSDIRDVLSKMEKEFFEKNIGWVFLFRGYCLEFLVHCLRKIIAPTYEHTKQADNLAIEVTKFMQKNYSEKITLKDIADALNISQRHAQRIFTDYFGVSCAKALNLYRMNYAKHYLVMTDLTVEKIAEQVGISSAQSLNKLFKDHEQMSANEYRTKKKEWAQNKFV